MSREEETMQRLLQNRSHILRSYALSAIRFIEEFTTEVFFQGEIYQNRINDNDSDDLLASIIEQEFLLKSPGGLCAATSLMALFGPDAIPASSRIELIDGKVIYEKLSSLAEADNSRFELLIPYSYNNFLERMNEHTTLGSLIFSFPNSGSVGHIAAVVPSYNGTYPNRKDPDSTENYDYLVVDIMKPARYYNMDEEDLPDLYTSAPFINESYDPDPEVWTVKNLRMIIMIKEKPLSSLENEEY